MFIEVKVYCESVKSSVDSSLYTRNGSLWSIFRSSSMTPGQFVSWLAYYVDDDSLQSNRDILSVKVISLCRELQHENVRI